MFTVTSPWREGVTKMSDNLNGIVVHGTNVPTTNGIPDSQLVLVDRALALSLDKYDLCRVVAAANPNVRFTTDPLARYISRTYASMSASTVHKSDVCSTKPGLRPAALERGCGLLNGTITSHEPATVAIGTLPATARFTNAQAAGSVVIQKDGMSLLKVIRTITRRQTDPIDLVTMYDIARRLLAMSYTLECVPTVLAMGEEYGTAVVGEMADLCVRNGTASVIDAIKFRAEDEDIVLDPPAVIAPVTQPAVTDDMIREWINVVLYPHTVAALNGDESEAKIQCDDQQTAEAIRLFVDDKGRLPNDGQEFDAFMG